MENFLLFVLVGFLAQLIDGVLGMAYGVSATTFLLSFGIPPAVASASVHAAEVVTTGFSGASHLGFGNVDKSLVRRLVIPGVIGAALGAGLLVSFPGETIAPWISAYLLLMGIVIVWRAIGGAGTPKPIRRRHLIPLGFAGGFFDAAGGGGWGPIVAGTLLARGNAPRETIGSVNLAEFFVTLAASITFVLTIGLSLWTAIAGLAIGGALAAPLAALAVRRAPVRPLLAGVGILIILLSARSIVNAIVN